MRNKFKIKFKRVIEKDKRRRKANKPQQEFISCASPALKMQKMSRIYRPKSIFFKLLTLICKSQINSNQKKLL